MSTREFDVIVLGLGGIGSGAAYWLARRGARVVGIEQFELGHARGESHDHSRIIRLSYHTPYYVALAKFAYAAWSAVEAEAGEQLVLRTGGLDLGPRDGAIPLETYAESMRAESVAFEELDAAQIRERWTAFTVDDDVHGLYQRDGGIVSASRATAAHQRLAREHGALLIERTPVTEIFESAGEVFIEAGGERFVAGKLVIAAGPWSAAVLRRFDLHVPLEVTKEQVHYFVPRAPEQFAPDRFPVWIWMDDPSFYGFPIFGERAVKVTQDAGGRAVDPDTRDFVADPAILARTRAFLEQRLPAALGPELLVKTCLYTLPPDREFIVDKLPGRPNVTVAIGAGHAFKFASAIGSVLADLTLDGSTVEPIGAFTLERPILQMASPPKQYMV